MVVQNNIRLIQIIHISRYIKWDFYHHFYWSLLTWFSPLIPTRIVFWSTCLLKYSQELLCWFSMIIVILTYGLIKIPTKWRSFCKYFNELTLVVQFPWNRGRRIPYLRSSITSVGVIFQLYGKTHLLHFYVSQELTPLSYSPDKLALEKIDNQCFIPWMCWRQSSDHVVKSPHPPPPSETTFWSSFWSLFTVFSIFLEN